ncbi:MAG: hypothetical protein GF375_04880 [Candidatus Omnitrophica bacterium]|nr:hypothetical protein [Candidatus Omnitrophota bacterium]
MTVDNKTHSSPDSTHPLGVNPVCTNQVKLDSKPTPEKIAYMKKCHEARNYLGALPVRKKDDGSPIYAGKNWAVQHACNCLMDGLKSGKVKWDDVLGWAEPVKAEKSTDKAKKPEKKSEGKKATGKASKSSKAKGRKKTKAKKSSPKKSKRTTKRKK